MKKKTINIEPHLICNEIDPIEINLSEMEEYFRDCSEYDTENWEGITDEMIGIMELKRTLIDVELRTGELRGVENQNGGYEPSWIDDERWSDEFLSSLTHYLFNYHTDDDYQDIKNRSYWYTPKSKREFEKQFHSFPIPLREKDEEV